MAAAPAPLTTGSWLRLLLLAREDSSRRDSCRRLESASKAEAGRRSRQLRNHCGMRMRCFGDASDTMPELQAAMAHDVLYRDYAPSPTI